MSRPATDGQPTLTMRVDALRDDVLRVQVYPTGMPAEDASWAVLPGLAWRVLP